MANLYGRIGHLIKENINNEYIINTKKKVFVGSEEPKIPDYQLWVNNDQLYETENGEWVLSIKTFDISNDEPTNKDFWFIPDSILETMSKPNWFFDNGEQVDDEYLINENIYPINTDQPEYDNDKFYLEINKKEDFIIDHDNKIIENYFFVISKTVDEIYNNIKSEILNLRNKKIFTDVPYEFPSGTGTIQLRNEEDLRNISINGMEALKDVVEGNPTKQHFFMDESNTLREMTAQQMVDMASFVKSIGQQIYSSSWTHKHVNLKAIYDNTELTDEQKIDQLLNYDYTINW